MRAAARRAEKEIRGARAVGLHCRRMGSPSGARRAYFSLAARGEGHGIQPYAATRDVLPSYFTVIRSMLCSFRLWRSDYPMILLAVNLTRGEQSELLRSGATRIVDVICFSLSLLSFHPSHSRPFMASYRSLSSSRHRDPLISSQASTCATFYHDGRSQRGGPIAPPLCAAARFGRIGIARTCTKPSSNSPSGTSPPSLTRFARPAPIRGPVVPRIPYLPARLTA